MRRPTFSPLHEGAARLDARPRVRDGPEPCGRLTSVGVSEAWTARVDRHAEAHPGVAVEHLTAARGAPQARGRLDGRARGGGRPRRRRRRGPEARRPQAARGVRLPLVDGPEPLRPGRGNRERSRGARHGRPEPDAARDGAAPVRRARPHGRGRGARGGPHRGEACVPAVVRRCRPGRHGDDAGVRRRRARPAAKRAPRHRVRTGGRADEDDRRRRDPPLARSGGGRHHVRHPGRGDHADVRRDGPWDDRAPRPRPSRAGRGAHGAGLRARVRPRRASRSRPRGRAPRTSSRRSPMRGWTPRRSSASRARCART